MILLSKKYFARANTSSGCVNLLDENLGDTKNIYILSGESVRMKGEILKKLSEKFENAEYIYSPFAVGVLEGVIFRDIKTAVISDALSNGKSLGEIIHCKGISDKSEEDKKKADAAYRELYKAYSEAKEIHDEWERIYIKRMDFSKLGAYSEGVIKQLIGDKKGSLGTYNYERFFGASTPDGSVNYIDNITENLDHRYFIKGRPGTGKSTFLKKLAKAANDAGFDTEIYHCSFDKDSLDMVLVPELSSCVFDSTAPHELFPKKEGDSILDFYAESGLSGTDEEMKDELAAVSARYKQKIAEGLCFLRLGNLYSREIFEPDEKYTAQMADLIYEKIKGMC